MSNVSAGIRQCLAEIRLIWGEFRLAWNVDERIWRGEVTEFAVN